MNEALLSWAKALPKIELHRHLEGSLRLFTLLDVAREYKIELPTYDPEEFRRYVQIVDDPGDFHHFLAKFRLLRYFYTSKEVIQRITREVIYDALEDNIRYLEIRFNPIAEARVHGFKLDDVVEWVLEAADSAQQEKGLRTCLILQIGREEPLEVAESLVDLALTYHGRLLRGIDLAGDEVTYPAENFARPFERARVGGLHVTVHAGEAVGWRSVRAAIECLGAERIGHGIRTVENSEVVQLVRERRVALEVCPTSNLHTGVVPRIHQHPLLDLFALGLHVTINTDDPSISNTTLSEEYVAAVEQIGMEREMVYTALRYGVEAAFIPDEERWQLREAFRTWLAPFPGAVEAFDAAPL